MKNFRLSKTAYREVEPMKWFENITSIEELRNHYKKLLVRYHPDNNPDTDTTTLMQEINSEYDALLKQFSDSSETFDYSKETELKKVLNEVIKIKADIMVELVGSWIWVSGNSYSVRDRLKELGFKWSSKKHMWYWGTCGHRYIVSMDMTFIRDKYGSVVYKAREEQNPICQNHN
jgi:hypothetical protein